MAPDAVPGIFLILLPSGHRVGLYFLALPVSCDQCNVIISERWVVSDKRHF